ncbi:MAG TPA: radical SAM protein [Planctomycetota bacterium]|nr:radical SAM protein [Planctomycetota bacterium]
MRILLIDPPFQRFMGFYRYYYPLGLASIAAVLRQAGHEVVVYDADHLESAETLSWSAVAERHEEFLKGLHTQDHPLWREAKDVVSGFAPDIVGITLLSVKASSGARVAAICKEVNDRITVVVGGDHPTVFPARTLQDANIDFVVRGEGEATMADLVACLQDGDRQRLAHVAGLSYRDGDEVRHNPDREPIPDLDVLPLPAIDALMHVDSYRPVDFGALMGSRGCPYACTFCGVANLWSRKVRYRSVASVIREMEWLNETYGTEYFSFRDASFTLSRERVEELCREISRREMGIRWECLTRPDLLDEAMVAAMKRSGCVTVRIGLESGSKAILRHMKKRLELDAVRRAAQILTKHGLYWSTYLLLGTPLETKETVKETLAFVREINPPFLTLARFAPIPGTEMYDELVHRGLISPDTDWSMECNQRLRSHYVYGMTEEEFEQTMREVAAFVEAHNTATSARMATRDGRLK